MSFVLLERSRTVGELVSAVAKELLKSKQGARDGRSETGEQFRFPVDV